MGGYSAEQYEVLFTKNGVNDTTVRKDMSGIRCKTIRHGEFVDVQLYPIWSTRAIAEQAKKAKAGVTRAAQRALNYRRSCDRLTWLANNNFEAGDGMLSCSGFKVENDDPAVAQKKAQAFLRRLKREWKKNDRELKYIYTMERTESVENGVRYHLHIICNLHGFDRDRLESLWKISSCNCTVMHGGENESFAGMARYLNIYKERQEKASRRHWNCSRNLVQPTVTVADHKISVRKAMQIAADMQSDARDILEKVYKNYRLTRDVEVRSSDFVPGCYVYARLRRIRP